MATGGSDYNHPRTRITLLVGADDRGQQPYANEYFTRLKAGGSPMVTLEIVPNTPHGTLGTVEGRAAVRAALLRGS